MATDPSDEWELSKENFQPIKQGRPADRLVPVPSSDAKAVESSRRCGRWLVALRMQHSWAYTTRFLGEQQGVLEGDRWLQG